MVFGNKEGKTDKKTQKYLEKKGVSNLESNVDPQVRAIADDLAANGLFKAGLTLSFAKAEEQSKLGYLSAQVEQNWIIIKQQDEILKELKS